MTLLSALPVVPSSVSPRQVPQHGCHRGAAGPTQGQGQQREDGGRHLARSHGSRPAGGERRPHPLSGRQGQARTGERLSRSRSPQGRVGGQEARPALVGAGAGSGHTHTHMTHANTHTHTRTHAHAHTNIYTHIHTHTHTHTHTRTHARTHASTQTQKHTRKHTHTHTHKHTYTHTHVLTLTCTLHTQ